MAGRLRTPDLVELDACVLFTRATYHCRSPATKHPLEIQSGMGCSPGRSCRPFRGEDIRSSSHRVLQNSVPACSSHHLADTVKGGQLSYPIPAMQREQRTYRSLLARVGAVMAYPEPMLPRLVRGCIAITLTALV